MKATHILTACALLLGAASSFSQTATRLPHVAGEVRKVDVDAQKITLRHGEIPNLDMGAMTMVFRVRDPELLREVKPGDKVSFTADKLGGALTVMSMEVTGP